MLGFLILIGLFYSGQEDLVNNAVFIFIFYFQNINYYNSPDRFRTRDNDVDDGCRWHSE